MWICKESQVGTFDFTKEKPKENWTHLDAPDISDQDETSTSFKPIHNTTDNTPTIPILSHDTLAKIVNSVVSIVKKELLKDIINTTLAEIIKSEVFKDTLLIAIQSAHSVNSSLRHKLIIERKDMEKVADTAVDIIKGESLINLVNKAME